MSLTDLDSCVREILLADELLPDEVVEEAESILDKMRGLGLKKDLVDVLIHREFVPLQAAEELRQRAEFMRQRTQDELLVRIVKGGDLVAPDALAEVLDVQEALFNAKREVRPLAEILLARKLLSEQECDWARKALQAGRGASAPPTPERARKREAPAPPPSKPKPAPDAPVAPPPSRLSRDEQGAPDPPQSQRARKSEPAEPPAAPPSKAGGTGTKRLPAVSQRRRRVLPSGRSLMLAGLVVGGIGLTAGVFFATRWLERTRVEEQFQKARGLVTREKFLEAEEAFRAFLEKHPKSARHQDAVLELQKLLLNRAEVKENAGMVEVAIESYRQVRLLDATTPPAERASKKLAELAAALERRKLAGAWDRYVRSVQSLLDARAYRDALARLARSPIDKLTEAQRQALEGLREQARQHLQRRVLSRYVFLEPGKCRLPGGPPRGGVALARSVKRYALADDEPVADGPGASGALLVPVGRMLHAVEARSGRLLWQRSLGRGRVFAPVRLRGGSSLATAQDQLPPLALVVHPGRRSVSLIEATSGKIRWERFFSSPISAAPSVAPPHLFVGTERGRLYQLQLDSGQLQGAFPTGGEVVAPPAYEPTGDLLLIPSADGFLYVYKLGQRRFLGRLAAQPHPGVPPIVLHPFLFVPERAGKRTQLTVHRLVVADQKLKATRRVSFDLEGHIRTPASVLGGRVYCVTDAGVLGIFAVDPGREGRVYPLTRVASGRSISQTGSIQLRPTELGRQILTAGADLQLFDLPKPTRGTENAYNVRQVWSYEAHLEDGPPIHGQAERLLLTGQSAFVVSRSAGTRGVNLYAFRLDRRRLLWHRTVGSGPAGPGVHLADAGPSGGRLVVLTQDGGLHCLCFDKGEVVYRRMRRGARPVRGGRLARIDGRSLLVARGTRLGLVDSVTGERGKFALSFALKSPISSGPVVAGGVAYFGTRGGAFHAVDARTGKTRHDLFTSAGNRAFTTRPLVVGETVVVGCEDRRLYGLEVERIASRSFLAKAWQLETGGQIHAQPVAVGRSVWAASDDGKLHRIEASSGKVTATVQLSAAIRGPLLAAGGKLFCGTEDFQLNAVDLARGALAWRVPLQGKLRARPVFADGVITVATTTGLVLAVDAAGKPRWRLQLPDRFGGGALRWVGKSLYLLADSGMLYEVSR